MHPFAAAAAAQHVLQDSGGLLLLLLFSLSPSLVPEVFCVCCCALRDRYFAWILDSVHRMACWGGFRVFVVILSQTSVPEGTWPFYTRAGVNLAVYIRAGFFW